MCTAHFVTGTSGGPHMNKFEQVSSDYHQMYLAGLGLRQGDSGLGLYSEVQCIKGNGHMGPLKQNDRHLWKHYLSGTLLAGGN